MRRTVSALLAMAVVGMLSGALFAAAPAAPAAGGGTNGTAGGTAAAPVTEQVDNPVYKAWASHKVGTTVVTKRTIEFGQGPNESTVTQKLASIAADKVVLEQTTEGGFGGGGGGPQSVDVPAKVAKGQENAVQMGFGGRGRGGRAGAAAAPPPPAIKDMKEGTDKVDVGGKSMDAVTHEYASEMAGRGGAPGTPMKVKTWYAKDVPGGLVKSEISGEGPAGALSIKSVIVKFDEGSGTATPATPAQ